jgi:hypothetical protein
MPHRRHGSTPGPDAPPRPLCFQVLHERTARGVATTIAKTWLLGDAQACRACLDCNAQVGRLGMTATCLKKFPHYVPEAEAELFGDAVGPGRRERPDERARPVAG